MKTNSSKTQKQRKKIEKRRHQKRRAAVQHNGNQSTLITQNSPGYDVEMIRDFLDQLLLELRVQQYENVKALRSLRLNKDYSLAKSAAAETSPELVEQLASYHLAYCSVLLPANVIDEEGVCDEELQTYTENFLSSNIEKRDAEIGHLEALQEVIDEALLTAKIPFGVVKDGVVMPKRVHRVREFLDEMIAQSIPRYDDLLAEFEGHPLATMEGITMLKESSVIAAHSEMFDEPLLLYLDDQIQERPNGKKETYAWCVTVASFRELQFLLSAIHKFLGLPITDGRPWKDL